MPLKFDSITEKAALRFCSSSLQRTVNMLLLQDLRAQIESKRVELDGILRNPDGNRKRDRKENKTKECSVRSAIHKLSEEIECYENMSDVLEAQINNAWHGIKFIVENLRGAIDKNPDEPIVLSDQLHVHTAYIIQKILGEDGFDGFKATGKQKENLKEIMKELNLEQVSEEDNEEETEEEEEEEEEDNKEEEEEPQDKRQKI